MKLSYQPCPMCKTDTMHKHVRSLGGSAMIGMQCIHCDHINNTPSEQRGKAVRRHRVRVAMGKAPPLWMAGIAKLKRDCAAATPLSVLKGDGRRPRR